MNTLKNKSIICFFSLKNCVLVIFLFFIPLANLIADMESDVIMKDRALINNLSEITINKDIISGFHSYTFLKSGNKSENLVIFTEYKIFTYKENDDGEWIQYFSNINHFWENKTIESLQVLKANNKPYLLIRTKGKLSQLFLLHLNENNELSVVMNQSVNNISGNITFVKAFYTERSDLLISFLLNKELNVFYYDPDQNIFYTTSIEKDVIEYQFTNVTNFIPEDFLTGYYILHQNDRYIINTFKLATSTGSVSKKMVVDTPDYPENIYFGQSMEGYPLITYSAGNEIFNYKIMDTISSLDFTFQTSEEINKFLPIYNNGLFALFIVLEENSILSTFLYDYHSNQFDREIFSDNCTDILYEPFFDPFNQPIVIYEENKKNMKSYSGLENLLDIGNHPVKSLIFDKIIFGDDNFIDFNYEYPVFFGASLKEKNTTVNVYTFDSISNEYIFKKSQTFNTELKNYQTSIRSTFMIYLYKDNCLVYDYENYNFSLIENILSPVKSEVEYEKLLVYLNEKIFIKTLIKE